MTSYTKHITIDAPRDRVWAVVADIGRIAEWAPTISKSHVIGEPTVGIGARRFCRHKLMGDLEEEVIAWQDRRLVKLAVTKGMPPPVRGAVGTYELADTRSGSTAFSFTLAVDVGWSFVGRAMLPLMAIMLRRDMALGLAGLKHYVEQGGPIPRAHSLPTAAVSG